MNLVILASQLSILRGGRQLLDLTSLELMEGEILAVVGPNGAGKSTLLRTLTGEWHTSGRLEVLGKPLSRWSRRDLAQRMAVMPQQSHLQFDFSVQDVVEMGRLPHRLKAPSLNRQAVDGVIDALGLDAFRDRTFTSLSGGERQRVQYARVLAQLWDAEAPSLLLLDEPTSALDLAQQKQVLDLARVWVGRGCSVLAVLHDLNLAARYADRMLVMKAGRSVQCGQPEAVLTQETLGETFGVEAVVERAHCDARPIVIVSGLGSA